MSAQAQAQPSDASSFLGIAVPGLEQGEAEEGSSLMAGGGEDGGGDDGGEEDDEEFEEEEEESPGERLGDAGNTESAGNTGNAGNADDSGASGPMMAAPVAAMAPPPAPAPPPPAVMKKKRRARLFLSEADKLHLTRLCVQHQELYGTRKKGDFWDIIKNKYLQETGKLINYPNSTMRGLIVQREAQLVGLEQDFSSGQVGSDLRQALDQFRQRLAEVKYMKERRERAKEATSETGAQSVPPSTPGPASTPAPAPAPTPTTTATSMSTPAPALAPAFTPTYGPRYAPPYPPTSAFTPGRAPAPAPTAFMASGPAPAFASASRAPGNAAVGNGVARQDDEEEDDDDHDDSLLQRGTKRSAPTIDISDDEDGNDGPTYGAGSAGTRHRGAGGVGAAGERRRVKRRTIALEIKDTSSTAVAEAIKEVAGQMASAIRDGGNSSLVLELLRRIERMEVRISKLEATVEELRNQE